MAFRRTMCALSVTALTGLLILTAAPSASADQIRRDQWALKALQTEAVWKISTGAGVTVAVIESSGMNFDHVDLKGNLLKGHDFEHGGAAQSPEESDDNPAHGTGMASIIAGHGHGSQGEDGIKGLAPDAKILPIRSTGMGYAEEIRYAVDQGASVINISETQSADLAEDREAVVYALKHDVLVVSGSGNGGNDGIQYPAKYPGVLTVGGASSDGNLWEGSNYGPEVLLLAPADRIVSAGWPGSDAARMASGTSDAAAYASAAVALLRSKFPDLTAGQLVNRLVKTASLPDAVKEVSVPDERYGYGSIQPLAALTEDIPVGPKYGPLKVPDLLNPASAGKSDTDYAAENKKADQKQMLFFVILGVIALVAVTLIVLLSMKMSRRNKNGAGGPGGLDATGGGHQYGQHMTPPQNPYQQSVQPQHNPYQQRSAPTQGQWPPQQ
ncbi:S8 family serine peptidase [Streptomyces sp. NPDC090994]|uniref:S8 family serine peptidase n=1 Tax=Streptomyces sp. NPDC090994 TaxID=3365969 RepID=UPI003800614D